MKFLFIFSIFFTFSCTEKMDISSFKKNSPEFVFEEYFNGQISAWGLFHDRFGNLKRTFKVEMIGELDGDTMVLDEKFFYDDGEESRRVWTVKINGDKTYTGTASDVVGEAKGIASGNALNWSYDLILKIKDYNLKVSFDDWMFLQEKGILINRAELSKFGIKLGVVTITFLKE